MHSTVQYVMEEHADGTWDRIARIAQDGRVYDLPAEVVDFSDSYVTTSGAPYEPEVTLAAGDTLKIGGVASCLMQTDAYDRVEFVPGKVTITTTRSEERDFTTEPEVTGFRMPTEPPVRNLLHGYSLVPAAGKVVRCWYCNFDFSFEEFCSLVRDSLAPWLSEEEYQRAFCMEMLFHYQAHRDSNDLPFVTTYFPGQTIKRPDGSIAAHKPGVVRTWKVSGNLLGPSKSWYDPTLRFDESIAADYHMGE